MEAFQHTSIYAFILAKNWLVHNKRIQRCTHELAVLFTSCSSAAPLNCTLSCTCCCTLYYTRLNLLFFSLLQVCHTLHWAGRPHLPPQLPAQYGLRDVRKPRPHVRHRLYQSPDEQLAGPRARVGPPAEHQHHLTEPADRERQDQSGGARDSRGGVPGPRWTQEGAAGHGTLPEIRCWEDSLSGEGHKSKQLPRSLNCGSYLLVHAYLGSLCWRHGVDRDYGKGQTKYFRAMLK